MNTDWQFRCAPLPAGYAERYVDEKAFDEVYTFGEKMFAKLQALKKKLE
jgi:hypothetical protein